MTTISDIFTIPTQVYQGDFVLRLTEGVTRPADTLSTYVVTPQLEVCFDQTLGLIKSALESNTSKGSYLHGSFGSGKSHFMAVLTLLLQNNPDARSVPELAAVVATHNAWTEGRTFLVVPYHMIGATSLEAAVLGHYADYIRALHPQAPTPGFYRAERLFDDARRLRAAMGDAAFFGQLGGGEGDDGWGRLGSGWDAASFDAALAAPPMSDARVRLVGDLVDAYFQAARALASTGEEGFVSLDEGLSIMSKHAQSLGYDAVVLFLDELILWLASHAADHTFLSREGSKVGKLVESMTADRPIPLVSFIARQRDLRELVGDYLPGAEQLGFADVLNWSEARFDEVTLEDRNLPAIVEKRLLRPRSAAAAQKLQTAFNRTSRVREEVMNTLLTRAGDRDMFRQVYPFSPALVQTLVAISSLLQRERTALKLMLQLLVNQRDVLQLGDIVPVGDLFDVIVAGDEPFTQAMRLNFDHAKKLYRQKLLPMLEQEHGVTLEAITAGGVDAASAQRFRTDDRLLKTLILSALAPEVEALRALTPSRLAALNHGTIRSPIPGQESQIVLNKCRNWAAQVGEIKIADEGANPAISLHIVGVDTEGILANAQSFDSYGNRVQKARSLLYDQLGLEGEDGGLLPPRYDLLWRGTRRTCEILCRNVRELSLESLRAPEGLWRIVIDFPFDREGHTPADDRAKLQEFSATGESSNCLVWLPSFLTPRGMEDLGRLVLLDHILSGNNLNQHGSHLSQIEREQARTLLQNQRDQMRQRIRNTLLAAYGISSMHTDAIDTSHDLEQHFVSLNPALTLQPPVGATFKDALEHLFAQALDYQFPAHPRFDVEVKRAGLRRVLEVVQHATQVRDGRVEVERSQRDEVRRLAVPLQMGDMGETHFVLRDAWQSRFLRKQAEEGMPSLTVRRLRAWMDQPEAMGLPRDLQNLVIMAFALHNNTAFVLHGGVVEPHLERLDDELELRQQPLPDAAVWQVATQRLAAILGIVASPLLNATSLATWVEETKRETARLRPDVAQLYTALKARLSFCGIAANDAPRLQTAQATLSLLSGIAEADEAAVVDLVAGAEVATSATAMGQSIKQAAVLVATLDHTPWELFDKMAQVVGEDAPHAQAIVAQVKDALTRDEHVVRLAEALQTARADAFELLTTMMQASQPPIQTPETSPVVAPPPPVKKANTTHTHRGLGIEEAIELWDRIEKALASNPELVLDLDWHLYRRDETSP